MYGRDGRSAQGHSWEIDDEFIGDLIPSYNCHHRLCNVQAALFTEERKSMKQCLVTMLISMTVSVWCASSTQAEGHAIQSNTADPMLGKRADWLRGSWGLNWKPVNLYNGRSESLDHRPFSQPDQWTENARLSSTAFTGNHTRTLLCIWARMICWKAFGKATRMQRQAHQSRGSAQVRWSGSIPEDAQGNQGGRVENAGLWVKLKVTRAIN